MRQVDEEEALTLLSTVRYGRVCFTVRGLPAVRPVDHLVDGGDVIIRTHTGAAVLRAVGQIVAFEADLLSEGPRLEWSVVVIGVAEVEDDAEVVARYEAMPRPMVNLRMDHVIRIRGELVTGQSRDDTTGGLPASA
jgi:nitroimidazol reductase NimA-like FMN-containing flavoprotein (pyridoxamine 5'-phosphate oxidase superfamily)